MAISRTIAISTACKLAITRSAMPSKALGHVSGSFSTWHVSSAEPLIKYLSSLSNARAVMAKLCAAGMRMSTLSVWASQIAICSDAVATASSFPLGLSANVVIADWHTGLVAILLHFLVSHMAIYADLRDFVLSTV
ncbi:hypothetical protein GGI16_004383 [Coemansia sp. S142-1]|nr:hypothetical protein GGI16_004383 [Coemansia sp. S142-1]